MSYSGNFNWRTSKEIESYVDRTLFELQAKNYEWEKRLSLRPRRCYWSGKWIRPFSYVMVALYPKPDFIDEPIAELEVIDRLKRENTPKWVSMPIYVYLQLKGKL